MTNSDDGVELNDAVVAVVVVGGVVVTLFDCCDRVLSSYGCCCCCVEVKFKGIGLTLLLCIGLTRLF